MLEGNFIEKIENKIKAKFEWVEGYIKEYYKGTILESYSNTIAKFCIKYNEVLFNFDNLKILFGNEDNWKTYGKEIFRYVFFALLYKDIVRFLKEHRAEKLKMLIDIVVNSTSNVNLLEYSERVSEKIIEYANIISTKTDIEKMYQLLKSK